MEPLDLPHLEIFSINVGNGPRRDRRILVDFGLLHNLKAFSFGERLDVRTTLTTEGCARMLRACKLCNVDFPQTGSSVARFIDRHAPTIESLRLTWCSGPIRSRFPKLRGIDLCGCMPGIVLQSTMPSLTRICVVNGPWEDLDPCTEFASSLKDTVEDFVFFAGNESFKIINSSWFEPLLTARRLQDLQIFGMAQCAMPDLVPERLKRGLRRCSVGHSVEIFPNFENIMEAVAPFPLTTEPESVWASSLPDALGEGISFTKYS